MVGEKSREIELLYQKIDKLEAGLYPKVTFDRRSQRAEVEEYFKILHNKITFVILKHVTKYISDRKQYNI